MKINDIKEIINKCIKCTGIEDGHTCLDTKGAEDLCKDLAKEIYLDLLSVMEQDRGIDYFYLYCERQLKELQNEKR